MGIFSKSIKSLDDLFVHTVQDIYYAEHQITKALPTMVEKASNVQLKDAFSHHLQETKGQVQRLEQAFNLLGIPAEGVTCKAIDGIIGEAKELIGDTEAGDVLDAAMLSAAQAVEHYEISRYGTLIAFAKRLGRHDVAKLFEQTLNEEKNADRKLTGIADNSVNQRAAA